MNEKRKKKIIVSIRAKLIAPEGLKGKLFLTFDLEMSEKTKRLQNKIRCMFVSFGLI